jgi:hypothetical protein
VQTYNAINEHARIAGLSIMVLVGAYNSNSVPATRSSSVLLARSALNLRMLRQAWASGAAGMGVDKQSVKVVVDDVGYGWPLANRSQ